MAGVSEDMRVCVCHCVCVRVWGRDVGPLLHLPPHVDPDPCPPLPPPPCRSALCPWASCGASAPPSCSSARSCRCTSTACRATRWASTRSCHAGCQRGGGPSAPASPTGGRTRPTTCCPHMHTEAGTLDTLPCSPAEGPMMWPTTCRH